MLAKRIRNPNKLRSANGIHRSIAKYYFTEAKERFMGLAYKITDQQAVHFITSTVEQWVDKEEAYRYSSARDFYGTKGMIELSYFY